MSEQKSLKKWAIENKVWEPKAWEKFLKNDIVPFYKDAVTLWEIYEFISGTMYKYENKTLAEIKEDNKLMYDKIVTAIYGGIWPNKDPNKSFAKFMYDTFGIQVVGAEGFEDSVKMYEGYGDSVRVMLNGNNWIIDTYYKYPLHYSGNTHLVKDLLRGIINLLLKKVGVKPNKVGLVEIDEYRRWKVPNLPNPLSLLPGKGESPDKLINLFNSFRQRALDIAIGKNPFTTFAFYVREIPLPVLAEFLNLNLKSNKDLNKIVKLADLLGLEAYSMIDLRDIQLFIKNTENTILTRKEDRYLGPRYLADEIIKLHNFLTEKDDEIKKEYEKTVKRYIQQMPIEFKPWSDYEPFFKVIKKAFRDWKESEFAGYAIKFHIDKGKIISVDRDKCYSNDCQVPLPKIPLKQFLLDIAPAISGGLIKRVNIDSDDSTITVIFHPLAEGWINKVIKGAGKT